MEMEKKSIIQYFIYIPIVATIIGLLYTGITTFNNMQTSIEQSTLQLELLKKDINQIGSEITRTKEDFTRELTRMTAEMAEARAYIDTSRDNGYAVQNTVSQNTFDIKELTRQLNGGW
jgi:cobalamin biosynthesis protein CbiG|tara:strand:+ start:1862 stop:2215 length:354 start_codon:yes stop_codon:yes gene_type:complete